MKKIPILDVARSLGLNPERHGSNWKMVCPFHDDTAPSLSFDVDNNSFKCFGCGMASSTIDLVVACKMAGNPLEGANWLAYQFGYSHLAVAGGGGFCAPGTAPLKSSKSSSKGSSKSMTKSTENNKPYTLAVYSEEKKLPLEFLEKIGVRDYKSQVLIPYKDAEGKEVIVRYRKWKAFWWPKGSAGRLIPYGLDRLASYSDYVILVEGESDSQTLWFKGYPALGIPGADNFKKDWVEYLKSFKKVYLHQEPDRGGAEFVRRTMEFLLKGNYEGEILCFSIEGFKDPNDLHKAGEDGFKEAFEKAMAGAVVPDLEELKQALAEAGGNAQLDFSRPSFDEILETLKADPIKVFGQPLLSTVAGLPAAEYAIVKDALKGKVSLNDLRAAVKEERRRSRIHLRAASMGEAPEAKSISEILEGCPVDLPVPGGWAINEDGIYEIVAKPEEAGMFAGLEKRFPSPIVLSCVQVPMDSSADDGLSYEVSWTSPNGAWLKTAYPAEVLFDRGRLTAAAAVGIPVDSENSRGLLRWLAALRDTKKIPSKKVVTRCGWHGGAGRDLFVLGGQIIRGGEDLTEVDWTASIRNNEKELVGSLNTNGDPEEQKRILLGVIKKYPLAGFLIGAAAAAPLIRILHASGHLELHGFITEVTSDQQGVGKSIGAELAASVFGNPGKLVRTFDRTAVAWEVVLNSLCDCPVFLEEAQIQSKEDKAMQLVYSLALGMGRERGSRSGGMRTTRTFFNTVLLASERSLKTFASREGIEARVISLPPVFGPKNPVTGEEVKGLRLAYYRHYGHAGQVYIRFLVEGLKDLRYMEHYENFCNVLNGIIPETADGETKSMALRMSSRVASIGLGLQLLLQSMGLDELGDAYELSFNSVTKAWEHIMMDFDVAPLWKKALNVIQSYAAENFHRIAGMEPIDPSGRARPPSGNYIGGKGTVQGRDVIGFYNNALDDVLKRHLNIEGATVKKGLIREGVIIPDNDGKPTRPLYIRPLDGEAFTARVVCMPRDMIFPDDSPAKGKLGETVMDESDAPF